VFEPDPPRPNTGRFSVRRVDFHTLRKPEFIAMNPTGKVAPSTMLRKVSSEGVGYTVVELSDVRHVIAAAMPRGGATFEEQTADALHT
jgi:hypothetical protein